ncbi:MAG: hypothetical protein CMF48_05955 [Legionellales bacterium]|nr:hypothetical protein [Legionellales bacterium]|tara:strand:- start:299 stop:655 length:357 start_codon:yes stop_codon:yes gene_type:complete
MRAILLVFLVVQAPTVLGVGCTGFAVSLSKCQVHTCTQVNPINIQESIKRDITAENGVCHYKEYIDNNLKLSCRLSDDNKDKLVSLYNKSATTFFDNKALIDISRQIQAIPGCEAQYD